MLLVNFLLKETFAARENALRPKDLNWLGRVAGHEGFCGGTWIDMIVHRLSDN